MKKLFLLCLLFCFFFANCFEDIEEDLEGYLIEGYETLGPGKISNPATVKERFIEVCAIQCQGMTNKCFTNCCSLWKCYN